MNEFPLENTRFSSGNTISVFTMHIELFITTCFGLCWPCFGLCWPSSANWYFTNQCSRPKPFQTNYNNIQIVRNRINFTVAPADENFVLSTETQHNKIPTFNDPGKNVPLPTKCLLVAGTRKSALFYCRDIKNKFNCLHPRRLLKIAVIT